MRSCVYFRTEQRCQKRRMLCREWRQHKHGFACFCNGTSLKLLSPPALPPKGGVMFSGRLLLFRCCFEPSALLQLLEHYEQPSVHAELCVLSYRAAVPKKKDALQGVEAAQTCLCLVMLLSRHAQGHRGHRKGPRQRLPADAVCYGTAKACATTFLMLLRSRFQQRCAQVVRLGRRWPIFVNVPACLPGFCSNMRPLKDMTTEHRDVLSAFLSSESSGTAFSFLISTCAATLDAHAFEGEQPATGRILGMLKQMKEETCR